MRFKMIVENFNKYLSSQDLNLSIAMKIKDMMPAEQSLSMTQEDFRDLVVSIYDKFFDDTGEGWDPYDEDIDDIKSHLTIEDDNDF